MYFKKLEQKVMHWSYKITTYPIHHIKVQDTLVKRKQLGI